MVVLDEGLVLQFPFGEGSGSVANDRTKEQNHGVIDGAKFVRAFEETNEASWLDGWDGKRIRITIDADDIDGDLTDFPILIALGTSVGIDSEDVSSVFDELTADGNRLKIAVTTSDGQTQCYVEIEYWDDATETAYLWVKVPSIDDTDDTILYLYYDNTHADNTTYVGDPNSVPAENVWNADFELVTHMQDDPNNANVRDSTTNDWDGAKTGANEPNEVAGKIGRGQEFDGTNDVISCGDVDIDDEIAIEFWYKQISGDLPCAEKLSSYLLYWDGTSWIWGTTFANPPFGMGGFSVDDDWHHVVYTFKKNDKERLWHDGIMVREDNAGALFTQNNSPFQIGHLLGTFRSSTMDEVRLHLSERTSSWWKANFETQRDHMLTFESERNYTECDWKHGKAMFFDGVDDNIEVDDDSSLDINNAITIVAWIKPRFPTGLDDFVAKRNTYRFSCYETAVYSYLTLDGGLITHLINNVLTINKWTFLVLTYDKDGGADNWKIYIDGIIGNSWTETGAIDSSAHKLGIGQHGGYNDNHFGGLIDEVRIYNRVLSPAEIMALYKKVY